MQTAPPPPMEQNSRLGRKVYCVTIEGLIASGKTGIIQKTMEKISDNRRNESSTKKYSLVVIPDRFDLFNQYEKFAPLELCAENMRDNCAVTEMHIVRTVNCHLRRVVNHHVKNRELLGNTAPVLFICDRSLYSPTIFIRALQKLGYINDFTTTFLLGDATAFLQASQKDCNLQFVGMVYLETRVDRCLEGIQSRGRPFEQSISRKYLEALVDAHEDHCKWWKESYGSSSLFRLNADHNPVDELTKVLEQIAVKIQSDDDTEQSAMIHR